MENCFRSTVPDKSISFSNSHVISRPLSSKTRYGVTAREVTDLPVETVVIDHDHQRSYSTQAEQHRDLPHRLPADKKIRAGVRIHTDESLQIELSRSSARSEYHLVSPLLVVSSDTAKTFHNRTPSCCFDLECDASICVSNFD
jgi:hypothetical protein